MKRFRSIVPVILASLLFIVIPAGLFPAGPQAQGQAPPTQQSAVEKKALSIDDYGRWKTIASVAMSDDGQWACYIYRPREGDANLYVRHLDSEKLYTINIGSQGAGGRGAGVGAPLGPGAGGGGGGPMFSDDSHWIAYFINPPARTGTAGARGGAGRGAAPASSTGRGGAAAAATPAPAAAPPRKLELLNLATEEKTAWDNVASFAFVEGSRVLIIKRPKLDREAAHNGTDMIIHRLDRGTDELFGSTGEFVVNKGGALLAFTTDAADMTGNGVSVLAFATGIRKTLDSGKALYERMIWDEEGTALAVLKGAKKPALSNEKTVCWLSKRWIRSPSASNSK